MLVFVAVAVLLSAAVAVAVAVAMAVAVSSVFSVLAIFIMPLELGDAMVTAKVALTHATEYSVRVSLDRTSPGELR